MEPRDPSLAERLAAVRERLDLPDGAYGAINRLRILTDVVADLEAAVANPAAFGLRAVDDPTTVEIERLVDVLNALYLGNAPEAIGWRVRLVEILRLVAGGRLPAIAMDPGDGFGADLGTMLATDPDLAEALGRLYPLVTRATSVAPSAKWVADARAMAREPGAVALAGATRRTLTALVRADVVSRPDILVGGLRLTNQRLARGLVWFAAATFDAPAELLGAVGLRMGTSGRRDAVVRDTAVANTCAALLATSTDPGAAAALASLRVQVTNRNVLKQIERALETVAGRAGLSVPELVELALPTLGLDANGRLEAVICDWTAVVSLETGGIVQVTWRHADGRRAEHPPADLDEAHPAEVRDVTERVAAVRAAVVEERRRMEDRLASSRTWPEPIWRPRYADHPIGRIFGRRLIWRVGAPGEAEIAGLPDGAGWAGLDGHPLRIGAASEVRLWHPADVDETEIAAWRATLAAAAIEQPLKQAHREVFRPLPRDLDLAADRRFAGRVVEHGHLRSLLRSRGWAVPALGAWDQGDEATAFRDFEDGLRAELRYQAPEHVPTGTRQERARLVAVRFVEASGTASGAAGVAASRPLANVPPRVFSEALRDVSLVAVVAASPPEL